LLLSCGGGASLGVQIVGGAFGILVLVSHVGTPFFTPGI
jgi:hypothetical protein